MDYVKEWVKEKCPGAHLRVDGYSYRVERRDGTPLSVWRTTPERAWSAAMTFLKAA